jgi:hypothetical protein
MNDKDKIAFHEWFDGVQLQSESPLFEAWQAACEYKQREIEDVISFQNTEIIHLTKKIDDQDNEYSRDVGYLDEKIRKIQAEKESYKIAYKSNQEAALMSAILSDKNRCLEAENNKIRKALALILEVKDYHVKEIAIEALKEIKES